MKINYNLTGTERKSLVNAISRELNVPAKYLGMPTAAYEVGGYRIDKTGMVTGENNHELVGNLENNHGFIPATAEFDDAEGHPKIISIEMPLEGFSNETFANLEKLVAGKAGLIKKALDIDSLPIKKTETSVAFPWFKVELKPQEFTAYAQFISVLCNTAKKQKRVTIKEKTVENEKFAFRVFLIKLGFVGDEYKTARKILLKNLNGNSAFKNGKPPKDN